MNERMLQAWGEADKRGLLSTEQQSAYAEILRRADLPPADLGINKLRGGHSNKPEDPKTGRGSIADAAGQGLFGLGDELGAGLATGMVLADEAISGTGDKKKSVTDIYNDILGHTRESARIFQEENPEQAFVAEAVTGLLTGAPAVLRTVGSKVLSKVPTLLKASLGGGSVGAAHGFGKGDTMDERLEGAAYGGGGGAVAGPIMSKIGSSIMSRFQKPKAEMYQQANVPTRTLDELGDEATKHYKQAAKSGVVINKKHYAKWKKTLQKEFKADDITPRNFPNLSRALATIRGSKEPTYKQLRSIKRLTKNARIGDDKAGRKAGNRIDDAVGDLLKGLEQRNLKSGNVKHMVTNLKKGDELYSRQQQGITLQKLEEKALRSKTARSGNVDEAITSKAVSLLNSDKQKFGMDPKVIQGLEDLVEGSKKKNLARGIASIAPGAGSARGTLVTMGSAGVGGGIGATQGAPAFGALIGAATPAAIGGAFQKIVNNMTTKELHKLQNMIANKGQKEVSEHIEIIMEKYLPGIMAASSSTAGVSADQARQGLMD